MSVHACVSFIRPGCPLRTSDLMNLMTLNLEKRIMINDCNGRVRYNVKDKRLNTDNFCVNREPSKVRRVLNF